MANNAVPSLKPSEVYHFVLRAIACGIVPYVAGPPGIGKSDLYKMVAEALNLKMIDERLSQKLSEDLTGLPIKNEKTGKAEYLPFANIPLEGDPLPEGMDGWLLLLDELPSASEEVLAASYSMLLDHMVGGRKIHPKCYIVAAGNLASDSAIARELPDTLVTRMLCCTMKVSNPDWLKWAKNLCTIPHEGVINFIEENPNMLYAATNKGDRDELESYPQPRGWEMVMKLAVEHETRCAAKTQEATDSAGLPIKGGKPSMEPLDRVTVHLMSGAVGGFAAQSFREKYDENISVPLPWEIAQAPMSQRIPTANVAKVNLTSDIADYYLKADEATKQNLLSYINRLGGEYSALFASRISEELPQTPSGRKEVEQVNKRLDIDPLLGASGGQSSASDDFQ